METIELNDTVSVVLTGIGASIINERNMVFNNLTRGKINLCKTDYREKDTYKGLLVEMMKVFSDHMKRSSLIPFYNLHKI
jgi:hypothetical protein